MRNRSVDDDDEVVGFDERDELGVISGNGGLGLGFKEMWVWRAATTAEMVFANTWSASGGGLAADATAAVGPFLEPVVTAAQRSSSVVFFGLFGSLKASSTLRFSFRRSSSHVILNRGESHRTIEEGSSNRMNRLSSLRTKATQTHKLRQSSSSKPIPFGVKPPSLLCSTHVSGLYLSSSLSLPSSKPLQTSSEAAT